MYLTFHMFGDGVCLLSLLTRLTDPPRERQDTLKRVALVRIRTSVLTPARSSHFV